MDKKTVKKNLQQWLEQLIFFKDKQENREQIIEYFFHQFTECPKYFYQFILFLKQKLLKKNIPLEQKYGIAERYLMVLSFLCERFGFYQEKIIMDDLCFQISDPKQYQEYSQKLMTYKKKSQHVMISVLKILKQVLYKNGFDCVVKGRYKNIYSVYKKIQKKPYKIIEKLHDIFAFRIIAKKNDPDVCFDILNLLHDQFYPITSRFKDYITVPKINGYQSLHTGLLNVVPDFKIPVEVQIRTQAMDEFAEKGLAAHFIYSKKKKAVHPNEKEKKLIDYFLHLSKSSMHEKQIHCFSYKGDCFAIKTGAKIIDFAHRIHSNLAKRAISAIVNHKEVPLTYTIQNGDCIKVLTSDSYHSHLYARTDLSYF